jgi:hypothetical protein
MLGGHPETIPVLQVAVVLPVHLPTSCVATSTSAPGQLVISDRTLGELWTGAVDTWEELVQREAANHSGDAISGAGCLPSTPITRVVHLNASGDTYIFKRHLGLSNTASMPFESGEKTWNESAEGRENTSWPVADNVVRPAHRGATEEVAKVASTVSSIGYASLWNVREQGSFSRTGDGPGTSKFWLELEDNPNNDTGKPAKTIKAADPAENGDVEANGNANCDKTKYLNVPNTSSEPWNNTIAQLHQKNYPLCGLSYIIRCSFWAQCTGATAPAETTVENLIAYITSKKKGAGQEVIEGHNYFP